MFAMNATYVFITDGIDCVRANSGTYTIANKSFTITNSGLAFKVNVGSTAYFVATTPTNTLTNPIVEHYNANTNIDVSNHPAGLLKFD